MSGWSALDSALSGALGAGVPNSHQSTSADDLTLSASPYFNVMPSMDALKQHQQLLAYYEQHQQMQGHTNINEKQYHERNYSQMQQQHSSQHYQPYLHPGAPVANKPALLSNSRNAIESSTCATTFNNCNLLATPPAYEAWYAALMGLAEAFRSMSPPNIRLSLHCLKSILHYKLPDSLTSRTHLLIGKTLFHHSRSIDQIQFHLAKAWDYKASLRPPDDAIAFEAADLLAELYDKHGTRHQAEHILNEGMSASNNSPYWHCRYIFKLAQCLVTERQAEPERLVAACEIITLGSEYAQLHNSEYTRGLFLLTKCMLLIPDRQLSEVHNTMMVASNLIDNFHGSVYRKEALRIYFLILQVAAYLIAGQVKSAKPALRSLQQSIQHFSAMEEDVSSAVDNNMDLFHWLPREHMCVLVYLLTISHSMQSGYYDKVQRYTDKALTQIEKLNALDSSPILGTFQLSILESLIMCHLVTGSRSLAATELGHLCRLCHSRCGARLIQRRSPQLHTLLGLFAMSVGALNAAESQLRLALSIADRLDLRQLAAFNLAIVLVRLDRGVEAQALLDREGRPETLQAEASYSLKAASYFVRGLKAFFEVKQTEAKYYLKEALKMSYGEDLNRLTASCLILLGQLFTSLGSQEDANSMVQPAWQLAAQIPDENVALWAHALLRDYYNAVGDSRAAEEQSRRHEEGAVKAQADVLKATQAAEAVLLDWLEGPLPTTIIMQPHFSLSSTSHESSSNVETSALTPLASASAMDGAWQ